MNEHGSSIKQSKELNFSKFFFSLAHRKGDAVGEKFGERVAHLPYSYMAAI